MKIGIIVLFFSCSNRYFCYRCRCNRCCYKVCDFLVSFVIAPTGGSATDVIFIIVIVANVVVVFGAGKAVGFAAVTGPFATADRATTGSVLDLLQFCGVFVGITVLLYRNSLPTRTL